MTKLLLLDLDGTVRWPLLRRDGSRPAFIAAPRDQELMPGAAQALALFQKEGWTIVGVSNQVCVDAGIKSLADCMAEQKHTMMLAPAITRIHFSPRRDGREMGIVWRENAALVMKMISLPPESEAGYTKPAPGMLLEAMKLFPSISQCVMVGDRPEDAEAARRAGVDFMPAEKWRSLGSAGLANLTSFAPPAPR